MQKISKIILIFYLILGISYVVGIMIIDHSFDNVKNLSPNELNKIEFTITRIVNVNQESIFNELTNVERYQYKIPYYVNNVNVINKTGNSLFAHDELLLAGGKITIVTKHTIIPFTNHTVEAFGSNLDRSIISQYFERQGNDTKITTHVKIIPSGLFVFLKAVPILILERAYNDALDEFINVAKGHNDEYYRIVDDVYREVLFRPADKDGLAYYGSMLESGKMSVDDVRKSLQNSEEKSSISYNPYTKYKNATSEK